MSQQVRAKAIDELERILERCRDAGLTPGAVIQRDWSVEADIVNGREKVKVVVWFSAKGKLTTKVQGKDIPLTQLIRMQSQGHDPLVSSFFDASVNAWIGVDESGKGDYFGPLVTAAVLVTPETRMQLKDVLLRDSKEMQPSEIASSAQKIRKICAGSYDIVATLPEKYNELLAKESFKGNSQNLLAWQHARAIENLLEKFPHVEHAVVDQFSSKEAVKRALMKRGKNILVLERTKAEQDPAVAAAAILARDSFVHRMKQFEGLAGTSIPFGASNETAIASAARHIIQTQGRDALKRFAKLHFKTTVKLGL